MDSKTNIQQLKDLIGQININFPSSNSDKLSYLQELQYLSYAINKCVETINEIDPETVDEELQQLKTDLENTQTKITNIQASITSLENRCTANENAITHKVTHSNSPEVVYCTNSVGADQLIQFKSTTAPSTMAIRTSTGQLVGADATEDTHLTTYGQMKTYVAEHSGGGGGLSLHKTYNNIKKQSYTVVDDDVYAAIKTNNGVGCLVTVTGVASYSSSSAPFSFVISPVFNPYTYNQKQDYDIPFTTDIGTTIGTLKLTLNYDTTGQITFSVNNSYASIYRIEIIKF